MAGGRGLARIVGALILVAATAVAAAPAPSRAAGTILFGATPRSPGSTNGVEAFEAGIGRQLDFVRVFETWNSEFPSSFHNDMVASGRKMLVSVKPIGGGGGWISYQSIANAQPGSAVYTKMIEWVDDVIGLGVPVWFTFSHEPEAGGSPGGTDAEFIAAWRRFVDEFRARGADNVEFVWIMTDYAFELPPSDRRHAPDWYPGDAWVDHIAADAYNWSDCRVNPVNPWRTLEDVIDPLREFGLDHPDKGLILAEWASAEDRDGGVRKAAWISEAAQLLKQPGWEQFIAVAWFGVIDATFPGCAWPADSTQRSLDALAAMAADPFYGGGGPSALPSVTITTPAAGSDVSGTISVTAEAADDVGVMQVVFSVDGSSIGVDTNGADGWSAQWDTTTTPEGPVLVSAVATDTDAQTATDAIFVTVDNVVDPPPDPVVFSGVADNNNQTGPRWSRTTYTAQDTGLHEFTLDWTGTGDLRFDLRTAPANQWIADDSSTNRPKTISATLTAGLDYYIAVWANTGTGTFEVTVDPPGGPVFVPPNVSVTSPAQGATVDGTITVSASASDSDGSVTQVEFFANGTSLGVDTNATDGWSTSWDTTTVGDGTATVTATATDNDNLTDTDSNTVTVDNVPPLFGPTVTLTAPAQGATVEGTITVSASASDSDGSVTQVEFFADGTSLGVDTNATDGWSTSWDTTTVGDGTTTVTATATDNDNLTGTDSNTVTVDNVPPLFGPTVTLTAPAQGATVEGTITVSASASDSDGSVTQVEFFADGTSLGVDTNATDGWSLSWDTTTVGDGTTTVTATATDNDNLTGTDSNTVTVDNVIDPPPDPVVFSGVADNNNQAGPRWSRTVYTAQTTGIHEFTLDWTGTGDLRFDLRVAPGNQWVAANVSTDRPKTISATLTAGLDYYIAVWANTGTGTFEVTVDPPGGPVFVPPNVSVTSPANGATVEGTITVSASASDSDGSVTQVEFFADGTSLGVDTNATDGWSTSWDTTTVGDGTTTVTATATDNDNLTGTDSNTVTVDNVIDPPPDPVVFSGVADNNNQAGPRWSRTVYTAQTTGIHEFTLDWTGTGDLRFDLRVAPGNQWVAANVSTDRPKTISATLTAGLDYYIAVWANTGTGTFEVTVDPL